MTVINEERILSLIKYFVAKPDSILKELVQNSRRAKAKNVNITLKDNELIYTDDGNGILSYKSLLVLGETGWDNETVENETPAGFGFYSLISHAESINLNYGDLVIDCPLFLKNAKYRSAMLDNIENLPTREGFHLEATLLPDVRLNGTDDSLCYFEDMNIYVNGDKKNTISAEVIAEQLGDEFIRTQYEGNDLFIKKDIYIYGNQKNIKNLSQLIIYRGEPIHVVREYMEYSDNNIVYIIKQGSPLNIQLPFRDNIKQDDKYDKFIKFCESALSSYVQKLINNKDKFHLRELSVNDDYEAKIIKKAIMNDECEGFLLEYTKDQFYDNYADKFLILTKPEKVEKIEEVLGSKIVILKRKDDFEIASNNARVDISYMGWPIYSQSEAYTKALRYLKGVDVINMNKVMSDIPVISYDRLGNDEYMVGVTPESVSSSFPVTILVKNKDDIIKLWPKIRDSSMLYGHILVSGNIDEDIEWSEQVHEAIDDMDEAISRKYDELGFIVDKVYNIIDGYGYGDKIGKNKIASFIKKEVGEKDGKKRRRKTA